MLDKLNYGCYNADREWSMLQFVTVSDMTDAYLLIRSRVIFTSGVVFLLHIMCISLQKRDFSLVMVLELGIKSAWRKAWQTWVRNPDTNSSGITLSLAKLGHQAYSHHSNHLNFSSYPTDSVCVCLCEYTRACLYVCACVYIYNTCVRAQVSFNYETYTFVFCFVMGYVP